MSFRIQYPIEAFDGGLNNKYEPSIIADIESPDCKNVVFGDLGSVGTRDGITKFNSTAVQSFAGDGLFTARYNNGNQSMIAWYGGAAYSFDSTGTFTTIASSEGIYTAGTRVDMKMYQNLCFFGNGTTPYKYSGTDFTRHGIPAPNSAGTVATSSAGTLTGMYTYKIAYKNSFVVVGDANSSISITGLSSERTYLTSIPVAPQSFGVAGRRIYRTVTSGATFFFLADIDDNTTAVYEDNISDSALGSEMPSDQGEPPNWKYAAVLNERLFLVDVDTDPQYVYWTEAENPFVVEATNFMKISDGDGEKITGLAVHSNSLVVYKENSVWLIYMQDNTPANWVKIKTDSKVGGASHYAIADFDNFQMYIGKQYDTLTGFHALSGAANVPDATLLTTARIISDSKSDRIEPDVFAIEDSNVHLASAIAYKNTVYFAVPYGSGQGSNNRIYHFDYRRRDKDKSGGSFVPFTGINAADFTIFNGNLYCQSSEAIGQIYKMNNEGTFSDDGSAIDSYYWTKEFQGHQADADEEKDFRYGQFVVETLGDWEMDFVYRTDADKGDGNSIQVNLSPGGSLWGAMVWGDDLWGGGQTRENKKIVLGTARGKTVQFQFSNQNTASQGFKVLRGNFYYNKRGLR